MTPQSHPPSTPLRELAVLFVTSLVAASLPAGVVHALDSGRYHLGDNQYIHTTDYEIVDSQLLTGTTLDVPFRLGASTTVAVHIQGLWGVGGIRSTPHHNYVYLDGVLVGRIVPGTHGGWTSAGIGLGPGRHVARIRSEGPGDHDDFVLEGISVVTAQPVEVTSAGPSQVFSESDGPPAASSLGATSSDIDAWLQLQAAHWEERQQRKLEEENRQVLALALGRESTPEAQASARRDAPSFDAAGAFRAPSRSSPPSTPLREIPDHVENPSALRISALRLEPSDSLQARGTPPTVVIDARVDTVYVVRRARASLWWRWISPGSATDSFGAGPVHLGAIDRPNPTFRFPLPLAPPTPGGWTLEVTLLLDQFGAERQLHVTVEE
jgi:hypothetical protein